MPARRMLSGKPSARREAISGTLRHEGAVVAEDQELLARAFGQVEHQAIARPRTRRLFTGSEAASAPVRSTTR